jgi:hypothetical protein
MQFNNGEKQQASKILSWQGIALVDIFQLSTMKNIVRE